ncbi:hypothetical protein PCE1_002912 [Barthelona sp. PCE]
MGTKQENIHNTVEKNVDIEDIETETCLNIPLLEVGNAKDLYELAESMLATVDDNHVNVPGQQHLKFPFKVPVGLSSIRKVYRSGIGPSSSHTIGVQRLSKKYLKHYEDTYGKHITEFKLRVTLCGSLAATGEGHFTPQAVERGFGVPLSDIELHWRDDIEDDFHTNMIIYELLDKETNEIIDGPSKGYSIGGGDIVSELSRAEGSLYEDDFYACYEETTFDDIIKTCYDEGIELWEYIYEREERYRQREMKRGKEREPIQEHLRECWHVMRNSITEGAELEGKMFGFYKRKAKGLFRSYKRTKTRNILLSAAAYAALESASSQIPVVTSPTIGSCGVLPSVLFWLESEYNFEEDEIIKMMACAGLLCNIFKTCIGVSGAELGCSVEVGCAVAAASFAVSLCFYNSSIQTAVRAGVLSLESMIGLSCSPLKGYVLIPCASRNAIGACQAVTTAELAMCLPSNSQTISFETMLLAIKLVGEKMHNDIKETGRSGMNVAKMVDEEYKRKKREKRENSIALARTILKSSSPALTPDIPSKDFPIDQEQVAQTLKVIDE